VYYERQTGYDNVRETRRFVAFVPCRFITMVRDSLRLPNLRYRYFRQLTGRRHGRPRRCQQQNSGGGAHQETLSGRVARHCRTICLRGPYTATAYRPITIL